MTLHPKDYPYPHWELLSIDNDDRLRIVPERGGLITEWRCNGQEILYFDFERFLQKGKSIRGGIPILFPICGDLPNNLLSLPKGEFMIPQHGFARDIEWKIRQGFPSSLYELDGKINPLELGIPDLIDFNKFQ